MQPTNFDQSNLIKNVTYPETQWFLSRGQRKVSELMEKINTSIGTLSDRHHLELLHSLKSCLALINHPAIMQILALKNTDKQTTLSQFPMGFAVIKNINEAIEHTYNALMHAQTLSLGVVESLYLSVKPLAYAIMRTQDGLHGTFTRPASRKNVLYSPNFASTYYQSLFAASDGKSDVQATIDEKEITRMQQVVYSWIDHYNTQHPHADLRVAKDDLVTPFLQARQGQLAPLNLTGPRNKPLATLYYDEALCDFSMRIDTQKNLGSGTFKQATLVEKWCVDRTKESGEMQIKQVLLAELAIKSSDTARQFHNIDTSTKQEKKYDTIKYHQQQKLLSQYQDIMQSAGSGYEKHQADTPHQGISLIDGKHRLSRINAESIAPMFSTLRQYNAINKVNVDIKAGFPDQDNGNLLIDDQGTVSIIDAALLSQGCNYEHIYHSTTPFGFPTDKQTNSWRKLHTRFLNNAPNQNAWHTYFTQGVLQQTAQPHHQSYALLYAFYDAFCADANNNSKTIANAIKDKLAAYLQATLNQLGSNRNHSANDLETWNTHMNQTYAGDSLERFFCTHVLKDTSIEALQEAIHQYEKNKLVAITHHAKTLYYRAENGLHTRRLTALSRIQHYVRSRAKTAANHLQTTTTQTPSTPKHQPIPSDAPEKARGTINPKSFGKKQATIQARWRESRALTYAPSPPKPEKPLSLFTARAWMVLQGGKSKDH